MKRTASIFALAMLMSVPAALADWDADDLFKWVQMPDLDSTGIDVNASAQFILADDFLCTEPDSITSIHIWGSWRYDYLPLNTPNGVDFVICIYDDIPDSVSPTGYSMPGDVLWTKTFASGEFTSRVWASNLTEGFLNLPDEYKFPGDTVCYQYNFAIPEEEYFYQSGTAADPVVYWLSVQAKPLDQNAAFGWKTSLDHWNDDAVWGEGDPPIAGPWYELRYPTNHEMAGESIDLAFVIVGETYGTDWGDAPDTLGAPYYPTLAAHNGASHIIRGPYLGRSPGVPDPEADGQPHPYALGDDLAGYCDEDGLSTTVLVAGGHYRMEVCIRPLGSWGVTDVWVDYNADGVWQHPAEHVFSITGPGTHIIEGIPVPLGAPDGQSFARVRTSTAGPLLPYGPADDGEVEDHIVQIVNDMGEFKWLQTPHLGYDNVDVMATQPFILADDFLCTEPGRITEITLWGSWKDDHVPFGDSPDSVKFILSFHDNIPDSVSGTGYDTPGNVLWTQTFITGQFSAYVESAGVHGGWLIPPDVHFGANDSTCWRYKFPVPAQAAFLQEGTSESPIRYWLDVQAWPLDEDAFFGLKGSMDTWHSIAVYGSGMEPYAGPWYTIRDRFGRNLAFMLRADPASSVPHDTDFPEAFGLRQNVPNPFTGSTTIQYALAEGAHVKLEVFDVTGRLVTVLVDDARPAGLQSVIWPGHDADGNEQPTGIYFYHLRAGGRCETRKMVLFR